MCYALLIETSKWRKNFSTKRQKVNGLENVIGILAFFHKLANGRKRKNQTSSLTIDGEEILNFEDISNEATSFYENLYKKRKGDRSFIDNLFEGGLQRTHVVDL